MKNLFIILFTAIFPVIIEGQTLIEETGFPIKDGKVCYQDVLQVDSIDSKQLYLNAKEWVVSSFTSSKNVIQLDSEEKLIVRAFFQKGGNAAVKPKFWFTLKIEFKENRYRYTLHELVYEADVQMLDIKTHQEEPLEQWLKYSNYKNKSKKERSDKLLEKFALELDEKYKGIIANLNREIKKQSSESDNW